MSFISAGRLSVRNPKYYGPFFMLVEARRKRWLSARCYVGMDLYLYSFLTLTKGEVNGQLPAPAALPWEKSTCYLRNRRFGGSQNRSGRFREEKTILPLPGSTPRFLFLVVCSSATKMDYETLPWLTVLVTSLSTRRHVFDSRLVRVGVLCWTK